MIPVDDKLYNTDDNETCERDDGARGRGDATFIINSNKRYGSCVGFQASECGANLVKVIVR